MTRILSEKKKRKTKRKWLLSLTDPNMMFWSVFWPERRSTASAGLLAQVGRTSRTGCGTRRVATWRSSRSIPVGWRRWRRRLWLGFLWSGTQMMTWLDLPDWSLSSTFLTWEVVDGLVHSYSGEGSPRHGQVGGAVVLLDLDIWGFGHAWLEANVRSGSVD